MAATVIIPLPSDDRLQDEGHTGISDVEDVASYNWLDKLMPTILVPGIPPTWHVPSITPPLKPDSGARYVDQNVDRNPWSPLEPLVRAVTTMHPDFDFSGLDIVTDRRPLRHLLGFVSGKAEDFNFGVEVVGNVATFTRMEKRSREVIPPGKFQGYRRAFEESHTRIARSAQGSTSHHRVIRYRLGALQLLVRFAVDAYLPDQASGHKGSPSAHISIQEGLVSILKATSLATDALSIEDTPEAPGLTLVQGGQEIPHSALLEFSTRSKYSAKPFDIQTKYPDLWLSQMPHYVVALYQHVGTKWSRQRNAQPRLAEFKDIEVRHVGGEMLGSWEEQNQTDIRKLVVVLQQILKEAKAMGAPCVVRYSTVDGCLAMSKVASGTLAGLPVDLKGKLCGTN